MAKINAIEYLMRLDSGYTYILTAEEAARFKKKRGTTGKQYPIFKTDNGTEVAINKVEALEVYKLADTDKEKPKVSEGKPEPMKDPEEKPIEETRKETEAEFIAKSACTHKDVSLHFQNTKKGGTRYFPVCDFCGHRGRYIGNDTLTEEEIKTAKEWIEK